MSMRGMVAGLLLLLCSSGASATLIAYWNFSGYTDASSATTIAASAGTGTLTITGFPDADLNQENGTALNETTPTDPGNDALSLRNQANNGDYLELAVSLAGFQDPVLTYEATRNNNGFNSNQWSYSTNGGASFTNFGAPVNPSNTPINTFNAGTLVTRDFTGVSALANQASVILRYTVGGASGGGGARHDIDNIQINATTFIPEPSTCALMSLGLLGLVISCRRARG